MMKDVFSEETVNRILIGLGGQGCRIVDMVAHYLDSHGGIPKNEAFILIDSNDADISGFFHDIKSPQAIIQKKSLPMPSGTIFTARNPWFPDKYIALVGGVGAGQRRAFGKALYIIHRDGIGEVINKVTQDLVSKTNERGFVVILVSALGGGTGSSILADLSMDIRNWIQTNFREPIILGFGILPSMDEESITIGNSMAALKELHFIMSQKDRKDIYLNPFKMFVLTGRKASGAKDDDTFRKIALRFFVDLGFVPGKKKKTEDKWFDLNDLMTAVAPLTGQFSTIGYHLIEFPANKILRLYENEDKIKAVNSRSVQFEADISSIKDKINGLESQLENSRTNIEKLEDEVNTMELNQGFFSRKKKARETRGKLDLAKQQIQEISFFKDKLRKDLRELETRKGNLENELKNLKAYREKIYQQIITPPANVNMYQIRLNDEEINSFRGKEANLDITQPELASNFKQVMDGLGRSEEYDNHVHKPFTELQIATSPLLNYQHKMKKEQINPNVLRILLDKEFIKIDTESGGIVDEEAKIGYVTAILSSHRSNIDEGKLGKENAENILRRTIARHAQLFPLNVPLARFSVNIYTLMIGLHPWAPAPGYPSRLTDLDKMQEIYKRATSEERFLHHSLFLGDFQAFIDVTSVPIRWGDSKASVDSVIQFWKNYELVNREAKWSRVPITVADILRRVEELDNQLSLAKPKLLLIDSPDQFSPMAIANIRSHIREAHNDLNKLDNSLSNYLMKFDEGKVHLSEFISQADSEAVIDSMSALKINNFLETTSNRINAVLNKIDEMGNLLIGEVPPRIQKIDGFIKSIPVEHQTPQVVNHMIEIGRNLEDIHLKVPDMSKNLQQISVPLDEIRANIDALSDRLVGKE
jgi:archaellum component FlaC